jgi:polygalacturonase
MNIRKIIIINMLLVLAIFLNGADVSSDVKQLKKGWDAVPDILKRIVPPIFPKAEFNIKDYGAVGDGKTDCTE